jgi:uncharacterized protein (DUF849 family)
MILQATLNGPRMKQEHPAVPITAAELRRDATACERAGARAFHIHPRDASGLERLEPPIVDAAVAAVRDVTRWPVGVTSGAWIERETRRRVRDVLAWSEPDFSSVNLGEEDCLDVIRALLSTVIGVEAGVADVADAERLVRSGLAERMLRVLIEPHDLPAADALAVAAEVHRVLDLARLDVPRLEHSDGDAAWAVLEDAIRRGVDTRIGFEDTLLLPDGSAATCNAELVAAARALGAGED